MIRKIICGVINTLSVLVIAAAIVILCMVLFTEPGKPPNIFGFTMLVSRREVWNQHMRLTHCL